MSEQNVRAGQRRDATYIQQRTSQRLDLVERRMSGTGGLGQLGASAGRHGHDATRADLGSQGLGLGSGGGHGLLDGRLGASQPRNRLAGGALLHEATLGIAGRQSALLGRGTAGSALLHEATLGIAGRQSTLLGRGATRSGLATRSSLAGRGTTGCRLATRSSLAGRGTTGSRLADRGATTRSSFASRGAAGSTSHLAEVGEKFRLGRGDLGGEELVLERGQLHLAVLRHGRGVLHLVSSNQRQQSEGDNEQQTHVGLVQDFKTMAIRTEI
jgi:hypothetical protein